MKSALLENFRVKLLVGALATLFWFAVVTENVYDYDVEVPIVVANVPPGKILANELPATARVRFEGKGRSLLALRFRRDSRVVIDFDNVRQRQAVPLQLHMVHVPRDGVELNAVRILEPDTVQIRLSNLMEKPVRVSADVKITPVAGYTVIKPWQFVPDSVMVSGPEETVRQIDSVLTEPKEFAKAEEDISERLRLRPFPATSHLRVGVKEVDFFASVQKLIEVTLHEIPVQVQNAPSHLKIIPVPSTLSLTVEGGEKLLLNLKREDIVAYIDYGRIRDSATSGHPAYIRTPKGVRYRDVKPALFTLMMEAQNHASARR
jgi:YbbR domain-containing protein